MVCVAVLIDGDVALVESGYATLRYYRLFADMVLAQQDMLWQSESRVWLLLFVICAPKSQPQESALQHQLEVTWARAMLTQTNPLFRVQHQRVQLFWIYYHTEQYNKVNRMHFHYQCRALRRLLARLVRYTDDGPRIICNNEHKPVLFCVARHLPMLAWCPNMATIQCLQSHQSS